MPQFNVARKRRKAKIKIADKREAAIRRSVNAYSEEPDVRLAAFKI